MKKSVIIASVSVIIVAVCLLVIYKSMGNPNIVRSDNGNDSGLLAMNGTGASSVITKPFNIDDYISKGSNPIIKKQGSGSINAYVVHIVTGAANMDCFDSTPCAIFMVKDSILKYTNMKSPNSIEYANFLNGQSGDIYKIFDKGVAFKFDGGGEGMDCSPGSYDNIVYVNAETQKKIYEKSSKVKECAEFYDENGGRLKIEAKNIEDAYLQYTKSLKLN